jgi:iron complex transport system substrate-binding protein
MSSAPRLRRLPGLGGGLALALVLALTGCGADDGEASARADGATRSVTDATGAAFEVPVEPKRVVALSEQDLDGALALGLKPVGTVNGRGQKTPPVYLAERAAGVPVVGDVAKPTLDKVVEAAPDLILAGSVADQQILAQLRQVAPTVVTYKPEENWKTAFTRLGETLGKSAAASAWLAGYDKKVADAKAKLGPAAGAEVSIVRWNPQGPGVMQTGHFASLVAADLGLRRPAGQQEAGFAHSAPLSLEKLSAIDADWIFLGTLNPPGRAALDRATATPAFRQLGAVRSGHLVNVDGTVWTSRGGPVAAERVIDDVVKALAAA